MTILSICIPTYEMRGLGLEYLKENFDMLAQQTFTDFEVIVSDNSRNNEIEHFCATYNKFDIKYYKNPKDQTSASANINNAIAHAGGKLIKIIFQDDFLYHTNALQNIVDAFDITKDSWLITASQHYSKEKGFYREHYPRYNSLLYLGLNTISSPSVLTIKNENPLYFDEKLMWLMDCDYYRRCYDTFGPPKILNKINVVNRVGSHQMTSVLHAKLSFKLKELFHVIRKFNKI